MPEWPTALDVRALLDGGWRPVPFSEFVIKLHSRCDLACDYCYMYTMADQSWRHRSRRMSRPVIDLVAMRIAEHARAHELPGVKVILHGGEPLLAGPDFITYAVSSVRRAVGPQTRVDVTIQTNGVRLNGDYLDLFARLGVKVGVSVDGPASAHDRHRRRADGSGSYRAVEGALRRLAAHPMRDDLFGGLLCTIDIKNDAIATYEGLIEFDPPMIDLLLPHGNWAAPPPGRVPGSPQTPYADWLIAVFDRWYAAPRRETRVRLFGELMQAILGGISGTEAIGLAPVAMVVIDTDGEIELSDALKSAFHGAPFTGSHVARDAFDAVLTHPSVAARQLGHAALCDSCRGCVLSRVCGAGHYAHRYRPGRGFANPSVYCPDLFRLITHIRDVLRTDITALGEVCQ
ncbi:MAG TPA: FxsB family cyclophane-forming radical SAM/SPASM peptide maturase [Chloroflexota bacterium]